MNKKRNEIGQQLMAALHQCNLADVIDSDDRFSNENDLPRGASGQVSAFGHIAQALIDLGFESEYDFYCENGEVDRAIELCKSNNCYLRIPKMFFDDHGDRELPTPTVHRTTSQHYFIMRDDEYLDELIDDAKFYAATTEGWTKESHCYVQAARRLVSALQKQGVLI